jgi:hypothetical protein
MAGFIVASPQLTVFSACLPRRCLTYHTLVAISKNARLIYAQYRRAGLPSLGAGRLAKRLHFHLCEMKISVGCG